jgi:ethanolaminephosphotransferase
MNLKTFKYRGSDLSLSYKYLWSPFAEVLLKYTPADIAPNTITIVGFILQSIATVILCLQLPFSSDAPKWTLFLYGFCVWTYQMLDNLDGKQARKLQNSTPLGMIMDHGCDALGVICLSAGMGRVVCIDDPLIILWTFIFAMFSFYISAWCQYWSNGVMILGKFNGVDDGIPIIWGTTFFSLIFGQAIWRTPVEIFGFTSTAGNIIAYCVIVMTIGTSIITEPRSCRSKLRQETNSPSK